MAERTGIAWTRSSWSPWIGCTKVSRGCDACYAEALDARLFSKQDEKGHWGLGAPRRRTSTQYWREPLKWNKLVARERVTGRCMGWHTPGFWPVFPSLCDPFDNEVPVIWRHDFWKLVLDTPNLTWLLLTKRIGNVAKLWPAMLESPPPNVWLGVSIVNQQEADRDIPKLLAVPAAKRFVSYEPALGPVNWWEIPVPGTHGDMCDLREIDQIIVGGESAQGGANARPFDVAWARETIRQCSEAGVACFIKQLGSNPTWGDEGSSLGRALREGGYTLKHRAGANPAEWPSDLRVQEFPTVAKEAACKAA